MTLRIDHSDFRARAGQKGKSGLEAAFDKSFVVVAAGHVNGVKK